MTQTLRLVRQSIDDLVKSVKANPVMYFGESDLQSELFSILRGRLNSNKEIRKMFVWGTQSPKATRSVLSRPLHSELLLPEGRIDLAILDLDKVRMAINSKGRFGHIQLEPGQHVFIEIKASRTNRSAVSSRSRWMRLILADVEKLRAYSHPCFLLCFDFNRLLDDDAVRSLLQDKPVNLEVSYVRDDINDYYFHDRGPNKRMQPTRNKPRVADA